MTEILYRFHFPTGAEDIRLAFDADSFLLLSRPTDPPPFARVP